jgi:hypothetical protein
MANPEPSPRVVNPRERFKPIIDPAASTLDLEAYQSGAIIGTANSTAGGMDFHNINLPASAVGLWYIIVGGNVNTLINRDGTDTITMPDGGTGNTNINAQISPFMLRISCQVSGTWMVEVARGYGLVGDVSGRYYGDGLFSSVGGTRSAQLRGETGNVENSLSAGNIFFGSNCEAPSGLPISPSRTQLAGEYARALWRRAGYRASFHLGGSFTSKGAAQALEGLSLMAQTTDATPIQMKDGDGASDRVMFTEAERFYAMEAIVAAKNMKAGDEAVMWKVEFAVLGPRGAGAATLVGKNITRLFETANGSETVWDVDVQIAVSAGYWIDIIVTGVAATTIGWSASIRGAEVAGYEPPA